MKKILVLLFALVSLRLSAITTTYRFVSAKWESKIGIVKMDGVTDGFVSDKDATDYGAGYHDAQGRLYSAGVGVKRATSGAGATSCLVFENVTRIVFNFCQNSSKGKGAINVCVGEGEKQHFSIDAPIQSGMGVYNRDVEFLFEDEDGNVSFSVDCSENGIYINTITIEADNGSADNPDVSEEVLWIVTDPDELQTGDVVMFGVSDSTLKEVMSIYDENNSKNNIYSTSAVYDEDRVMVARQEVALYTVERADSVLAFLDATGYYLVASGGNPTKGNNNYLTIWDSPTSSSYGNYGYWRITIDAYRNASIENMGVSRSKYIQYNPNKQAGHAIFACYPEKSYIQPRIYKLGGNNRTGIVSPSNAGIAKGLPGLSSLYTLSGQHISSPQRGQIYISQGRTLFRY